MSTNVKRFGFLALALVMVCCLICANPMEAAATEVTTPSVEETTAPAPVLVPATCPEHEDCAAEWQAWSFKGGDYLTEDGHYQLTEDFTVSGGQIRIGKSDDATTEDIDESAVVDVVIDLAGYSMTSSSRVIYVMPGSTLTIMDSSKNPGTLTGGSAAGGAVLYLDSGKEDARTTLNLYDVIVTSTCEGTEKNAGAVYVGNYSDVNIHGATINGGKAMFGGTLYINNYSVVNMYSGLITGGYAGRGGNIFMNASTLNIYDGIISGGETHKDIDPSFGGGNIMCGSANSVINMYGGIITGGKDTSSTKDANRGGGNIYLQGTMNMTGGTISNGGTNASGGNILVRGTLNVSDGNISGGIAMAESSSGGGGNIAVRNKEGIVNISGGSISGGTVSIVRSDSPNGSFTVSGAPQIENLVIANNTTGYTLTLGEGGLTEGAVIGVTAAEGQSIFANGADASVQQYLVDRTAHTSYCPVCKKDVEWSVWTSKLTAGGHYYLDNYVTSGGQWTIGQNADPATYCLDLNGYSFLKHTGNYRAFVVYGGSTANVFNTTSVESLIIGTYINDAGGVINLDGASNLNLYDGIVLMGGAANDGFATKSGGVIQVNTGTFNMYGSIIMGQVAKSGGSVLVNAGGTFNMYGGVIQDGSAETGGNLYINGGTANISGGTITGGTSNGETYGGGNIFITLSGKLTVSGDAVITDGYSKAKSSDNNRGGANIYMISGTLDILGGTIKDGKTNASGGNIFSRGGTVTISGGNILDGEAGFAGGNIALRDNDTIITGGTITGGSIAVIRDGWKSLTVSGAPVIEALDLTIVNEGAETTVTLGEGGITGGSIAVNAVDGPFTAASEDATASAKFISGLNENQEISVNEENQICLTVLASETVKGDFNGDDKVDNSDVVALLWHSLFPEEYPLSASGDLNGDNNVDNSDVVALLWHSLFPEEYPL